MLGFEIKVQCTQCHQRNLILLRPPTANTNAPSNMRCVSCNGLLFEYSPVAGFVYILSNPDMPGLVKIGKTENSVEERVRQLASTGVPSPFVIQAYFTSPVPHRHEQEVHQRLNHIRRESREFFQISIEEALSIVRSIMKTGPVYMSPELKRRIEQRAIRLLPTNTEADDDLLGQIKIL